MFLRFLFVVAIFCHGTYAFSLASDSAQRKNSIDTAISTGDFYRAFRVGAVMEQEFPAEFEKNGLEAYLKSLFIIGSRSQILENCSSLSEKYISASYLCLLQYYEKKNIAEALKYYSKIKRESKFYWPAQIIKASCDLISSKPSEALEALKMEDLPSYKALGLEPLFNLTRARVLIALELYEDAVKFSQAVESSSEHYIEALEQTAWIFFKTRKLESSQILLDVIISSYESMKKREGDLKVSSTLYYKVRYLKAYLVLLEQRQQGASHEFSQLKGSFVQFLNSSKEVFSPAKMIKELSVATTEMNELPPYLEDQLNYLSEWLGADIAKGYERDIRFQVALNKEIEKVKAAKAGPYLATLMPLKAKSLKLLETQYAAILEKLGKSMGTLGLKAELGRLDVFWLNRSDGAKTLDDVIENYKQTTKALGNYMEL